MAKYALKLKETIAACNAKQWRTNHIFLRLQAERQTEFINTCVPLGMFSASIHVPLYPFIDEVFAVVYIFSAETFWLSLLKVDA